MTDVAAGKGGVQGGESSDYVVNNFNALIDFSKVGITTAVLVNGASALGILSFLGGKGVDHSNLLDLQEIAHAAREFGYGVSAAASAVILAFLTRFLFYQAARRKKRSENVGEFAPVANAVEDLNDHVKPANLPAEIATYYGLKNQSATPKPTEFELKKAECAARRALRNTVFSYRAVLGENNIEWQSKKLTTPEICFLKSLFNPATWEYELVLVVWTGWQRS
jgi:hypothetical protein